MSDEFDTFLAYKSGQIRGLKDAFALVLQHRTVNDVEKEIRKLIDEYEKELKTEL